MRAVTITKAGGPEVLTVTDHPVRAAGAGEVRIAVKAAAVNPTDILMRENPEVYAKGSPGIPGMDAAGVIESVGEGVERLKVGDEVMAVVTPRRPEGGAQIELLVVAAASVVPIPSGATLAQASTLPMNGLTARLALDLIKLSTGQTLAVSGGAGLLAHYMIALAKQRGLRIIADAKPSEMELVWSYGADVVVTRGDRFGSEVRAEVPVGVDALFDTAVLGRNSFLAIRDGGAYVPVRGWDGSPSERDIRIRPVMVMEAVTRIDWLNELRDLASSGAITLRVAHDRTRAANAAMTEPLARAIARRVDRPGDHETALPNLSLHRRDARRDPVPCIYPVSLALTAQGDKRVVVGDKIYEYFPGQSVVTSIEVPVVSRVTRASATEPYLGLRLRFDPRTVAAAAAQMTLPASNGHGEAISIETVDPAIVDGLVRLVNLLDEPGLLPQIAPLVQQEHELDGATASQCKENLWI